MLYKCTCRCLHNRAKHLATDEKVYWFSAKHCRWSKQENNTHQDEKVYWRRAQYLRTIADHRRCSKSSRGSAKEGPDWPVKDKQCKKVGCAQQQSRRFLFRFWSTVFHTHCSRKSILWKSRFPNRRGWRNKFVPHIWSGSDSEAAVAKGLPPTNPDVRENVLLYRYDLKVSKKEPLRRLLISKGHFFSRTPCSFCSSKVVWIG